MRKLIGLAIVVFICLSHITNLKTYSSYPNPTKIPNSDSMLDLVYSGDELEQKFDRLSNSICKIDWLDENGREFQGSGVLVNNTKQDGRLFVLTKAHNLIQKNREPVDQPPTREIILSDKDDIENALKGYTFTFLFKKISAGEKVKENEDLVKFTGAKLLTVYHKTHTPDNPSPPRDGTSVVTSPDIALLELTSNSNCDISKLFYAGWNVSKSSLPSPENDINLEQLGIVMGHPHGYSLKVGFPKDFKTINLLKKWDIKNNEMEVSTPDVNPDASDPNHILIDKFYKITEINDEFDFEDEDEPLDIPPIGAGVSGGGVFNFDKELYALIKGGREVNLISTLLYKYWSNPEDYDIFSLGSLKSHLSPNSNQEQLSGTKLCNNSDDDCKPSANKKPRVDSQNIRRNIEITENITGDQLGIMVATQTIKAKDATIEQGADIEMIAGDYTEFKTGFKVEKGARLLVENGNIKGIGCINVCYPMENQDTYSIENGELYGHVAGADLVETYFTVGGSVLSTGKKSVSTNDRVALLDIYKAFGNSGAGIYDVEAHYTNACDELIVNYEVVIDQKDIDDFSSDYYKYADDILDIGKYLDNKVLLTNHYQVGEDYNPSSSSVIAEDVMFEIDVVTDIPYAKTHGFEWSFRDNESYGGREFFNPAIITSEFEVQEKLDLGTLEKNTLKMDVYYPKLQPGVNISDAPSLPLVIYLFGGGFVKNANPELGKKVCEWLATKGYVVAAIDYRIGMDPFEGELAKRAVVRAWQDMEAAVKYWRIKPWNFSTQNPWKIDPDKIYGLGWSAGGITVLHNQYLSRTQYSDARSNQFGYLWSSTGNYQFNEDTEVWTTYDLDNYPTTPCTSLSETPCILSNTDVELIAQTSGVANKAASFAGAIGKDQWMLNSNNPTTDIHHSWDRVVSINHKAPFTYLGSLVNAFDILNASPRLSPIYGGGAMDIFASGNNQKNYYLLELNGATQAGGIGLMENYHFPQVKFESIMSQVRTYARVEPKIMFYVDAFFSGVGTDNGSVNSRSNIKKTLNLTNTTIDDKASIDLNHPLIYPNPTSDNTINVKFQVPYTTEMTFTWFDLTGRKLAITSQELKAGSQHIVLDVSKLPKGVFALQITGSDINTSSKVVINRG